MRTNKLARARKLSMKHVLFLFCLVWSSPTGGITSNLCILSLPHSSSSYLHIVSLDLIFPCGENSHVFYFAWNLSGVSETYHMLWSFSPMISLRLSLVRGDYGAWGS